MNFKEIRKKLFLTKEINFTDLSDLQKALYKKELRKLPEDKLADELFLVIDNPFKIDLEKQVDPDFFSEFRHVMCKYANMERDSYVTKWKAHKLGDFNDDLFNEFESLLYKVTFNENGTEKTEKWVYLLADIGNITMPYISTEQIRIRFRYEKGFEPNSIKDITELKNQDA